MFVASTRHLDVPRACLGFGLSALTVAALFIAIMDDVDTEAPVVAQPKLGTQNYDLAELQNLLVRAHREDFAMHLDHWRKQPEHADVAGMVLESNRGNLMASSGSFLDKEGRVYHSPAHQPDQTSALILRESAVSSIKIKTLNGTVSNALIRVFESVEVP